MSPLAVTGNNAVSVGQVGTGPIVSQMLSRGGATHTGYQWVHGPSLHPFEPHEALDGVEFTSFTDDQLRNPDSWPEASYFLPGDHVGCTCDLMPLWSGSDGDESSDNVGAAGFDPIPHSLSSGSSAASPTDIWKATQITGTKPEQSALSMYTNGKLYRALNDSLRTGANSSGYDNKLLQDTAHHLDALISKQEPTTVETEVFRGVNAKLGGKWAKLAEGDEITDPGFVSTSTDEEIATGFGSWKIRIRVPAGGRGYARLNRDGAAESEVLLPRGLRMTVQSVDKDAKEIRVSLETA